MVNMAQVNCYTLRRAAGAAALDFGVARLKDIAFERAIDGYLVPVFVAGKRRAINYFCGGVAEVKKDRRVLRDAAVNRGDGLSVKTSNARRHRIGGHCHRSRAGGRGCPNIAQSLRWSG